LQDLRERMIAELAPTAEQVAAIDRILTEARANLPAREPGASPEDRRNTIRQARLDLQGKIAAVLDPERREKLAALTAEPRRGSRPIVADTGSPGRVYVLDSGNVPQPIAVRLGVTDGSYTELLAGDLRNATPIIVSGGPRPGAQDSEASSPAQRPRGPRLF
jgi:HlyD family secretion protein